MSIFVFFLLLFLGVIVIEHFGVSNVATRVILAILLACMVLSLVWRNPTVF